MNAHDLQKEYESAIYIVDRPLSPITFRINQRNETLDAFVRSHNGGQWGFITAFNPRSELHTAEENEQLNKELEFELKTFGYQYFSGSGGSDQDEWPAERSFFVIDIPMREIILVAKKFDQNAIVWSKVGDPPKLIWCINEY